MHSNLPADCFKSPQILQFVHAYSTHHHHFVGQKWSKIHRKSTAKAAKVPFLPFRLGPSSQARLL